MTQSHSNVTVWHSDGPPSIMINTVDDSQTKKGRMQADLCRTLSQYAVVSERGGPLQAMLQMSHCKLYTLQVSLIMRPVHKEDFCRDSHIRPAQ